MYWTKKIGFLFSYAIPLLVVLGLIGFEQPVVVLVPVFGYVLVPLLDSLIGKDKHNVLHKDFDRLIQNRYFDFLVYSHVYIQYALLVWQVYFISVHVLSWQLLLGMTISQGIYAGTIINVAHELGHRPSKIAQWHAKAALISVWYCHFLVEHNRGHHVHVATPKDPATAKKNQPLLFFYVQTLVGSLRSAWEIEKNLSKRYNYPFISWQNNVLQGHAISLVLYLLPLLLIPSSALSIGLFLFGQALIAILSLETVNYIEHYGILRKEISPGKYEKVNPLHSWNANHFFSNLLLFNLQRHSDHHAYAARPYQVLRHFDISPQLPFGYPLMMLMATVPPLFFKIMNRRLENWQLRAYDTSHVKEVVQQFA